MMDRVITFLKEDHWPEWVRVSHPLSWLVVILLLSAALRIYGINNFSPPGLEHDEVANWLIDQSILQGNLAVYFQEAYGHEAGFHYLQAAFIALLGDHALALRLPAAFAGTLLVAVHFALTRRLFGLTTALISTAVLAVLFWPIFFSRLGLRAISLPLVAGIGLYAWWRAWPPGKHFPKKKNLLWFGLSGFLAGLSIYTYMAARAIPIFYALFVLYLLLFYRKQFKVYWRGVALFWILLVLTALPLVFFLQTNPGAEFRISEVDAPLRALLAGNMKPVLANLFKIGGMFGFAGDPLWRQNVAGRPVFDPLLALFFYGGLFLALLRFRDSRYAFLFLWLGVSALPSLLTVDAPSSIRMINALLVVTIFPVFVINIIARLFTDLSVLSTKIPYVLGLILVMGYMWWGAVAIFQIWPQNEEVQFVWQAALKDIAAYLDESPGNSAVSIGGWSPATLDAPTMTLSMRRKDLDPRYFGSDSMTEPVSTLILPAWGDALGERIQPETQEVHVFRPTIRELSPGIETKLSQWGSGPQNMGKFVLYETAIPPDFQVEVPAHKSFDGQIELIGYDLPDSLSDCNEDKCNILTYWRILTPTDEPRRFYLHALAGSDLIAQHDTLDAPTNWWHAGDLLVQEHYLPPLDSRDIELRLGIYDPKSGRRLLTPEGEDHVLLQQQ
jgi:4-amino-4-deoxy-L-arabinose transferase-like glycosyltransferase